MGKNIKDVLLDRKDISPFLVHLTKNPNAIETLKKILEEKEIKKGIFNGLLGRCWGDSNHPGISIGVLVTVSPTFGAI